MLCADCRFIIVACDGLWKRFDNDSAIEFVDTILQVPMSVVLPVTYPRLSCSSALHVA